MWAWINASLELEHINFNNNSDAIVIIPRSNRQFFFNSVDQPTEGRAEEAGISWENNADISIICSEVREGDRPYHKQKAKQARTQLSEASAIYGWGGTEPRVKLNDGDVIFSQTLWKVPIQWQQKLKNIPVTV